MDVEQVAAAAAVGKWETRSVFRGSFIAVFSIAECNRTSQCGGHVHPVHRLVEDEFFDLESFASRSDFLAKAFTYQLYFNLVRPNSHKQNLSSWQIVEQLHPRFPLQLCLLPPVFLDYYLRDSGGYDLPRLPYFRRRMKPQQPKLAVALKVSGTV